MRKGLRIASVILVVLLTSCSGDDESGGPNTGTGDLIISAMVGNWVATSAQFTTINANPVQSRDVIADGGFCDLAVYQGSRFTLVIRNPGFPDPQITTGLLVADGDFINVRLDSDPTVDIRWNFTISGNNLAIDGPLDYDFENDGILEETSANMQFIRN